MQIKVLQELDARIYQDVRLDSLRNDPTAFGSSYEREVTFSLETVANRIKPSSDKFVLGAFDDSELLSGIVTFMRNSGMKTRHKCSIYGMYVVPEKRKLGIGRMLMCEIIRRAREIEGLEQINLAVIANNSKAKNLYQSLGFEVFGYEPNALKYENQYYDEELMVLKI